jgi:hypothetical protein
MELPLYGGKGTWQPLDDELKKAEATRRSVAPFYVAMKTCHLPTAPIRVVTSRAL